jgi:hypothetical protein
VTGRIEQTVIYSPTLGMLTLPRADGVAIDIEHRLTPHLELEAGVRARRGLHLPTVAVPANGGAEMLASTGESHYRELQVSLRQMWRPDTQAFMSYVWSSSTGDINDFGTLYTSLTTPFVQPGGIAPTTADVPHRLRAWATTGWPHRVVVSPAVEWRTGFPYSVLDTKRDYVGTPNSARFPNYFAVDLTTFKTFDIYRRKMDLGLQLFNLTSHRNPRDVIVVEGSRQFRDFTNGFGATVGGYMQVRW